MTRGADSTTSKTPAPFLSPRWTSALPGFRDRQAESGSSLSEAASTGRLDLVRGESNIPALGVWVTRSFDPITPKSPKRAASTTTSQVEP